MGDTMSPASLQFAILLLSASIAACRTTWTSSIGESERALDEGIRGKKNISQPNNVLGGALVARRSLARVRSVPNSQLRILGICMGRRHLVVVEYGSPLVRLD